ncbi:MAG: SDR family NAD(P)-dependent oxidoreductase [Solirubrobacteraceae bacterium]
MRAAFVTGGSSGIGLAIARALGHAGHALTITSRRPERLEAAADELRAEGLTVHATAANLADEEALAAAIAGHEQRYERLDVLVNNAGMGISGEIDETPVKHLDLQLSVNLRAAVLGYHYAVPMLRRAGAEHRNALVVNTASVTAQRPHPLMPIYATTKAALVGLTRAMNVDLGAAGIKSCALCPGIVATEMTADEAMRDDEKIAPADVASAVVWLLSTSPSCVVPEIPFLRPGGVD